MITLKLNEILEIRDNFINQTTAEMVALIDGTVKGLTDFFEANEIRKCKSTLTITAIALVKESYMLVGYIEYDIGTVIEVPFTGEIHIDNVDIQRENRRTFQVKIPVDIVEYNDADSIFGYLVMANRPPQISDDLEDMFDMLSDYVDGDLSETEMIDILERMDTEVAH